jgi:PAS domain S-box-containing protein
MFMPSQSNYLLALRDCCIDEAAFLRLQALLNEQFAPALQAADRELQRQALLDAIPDIMFRIGRDGTYLEVKADRITDLILPPDQLLEQQVQQVLPPQQAQQRMTYIEQVLETGQQQIYEYQLMVHGELRDYEARIVPSGENEVLAIIRNITDRKRMEVALRESEQKFARTFHSSPAAISLTNVQTGQFLEVNESYCRISEYERSELIGFTSLELNLWVDLEARDHIIRQLQQHGVVRNVEISFRRKSGTIGIALMSAEIIVINEQSCFLGIIQEITDLKMAQNQLQAMNAKLEQQVAERTLELQQKIQQVQDLNQRQDGFLNAVSHDLRTPLLGMTLVMKNLLRQVDGSIGGSKDGHEPAPAAAQTNVTVPLTVLARMVESCDRQLQLINSILEARGTETRGVVLQLEPVQLGHLVQSIEQDMAALLAEQQATLINQVSLQLPVIQADQIQLRRVFENLLSNALQHNPPGLTLTLTATVSDDQIRLQLQDNGIGIDAATCERLFDRYTQGTGQRRSTGLGLGLYICRQIVTAHGGEIGVNSTLGQGTTFWFILPVG